MKKVLVIDTSVLCVWLKVPGKETCGPSNALVTYEMVSEKIEEEKKKRTTFILPLATIIENWRISSKTSIWWARSSAEVGSSSSSNGVSWAAGYSVCLVLQQLVLLAVLLPLLWELYYCCGLFLCSRGLIFLEL